jgi:uncharacterized protein (TIGR00725 family)
VTGRTGGLGDRPQAAFFGGCVPASDREQALAHDLGVAIAGHTFTLLHGGYNGLMEHAAKGAADHGGHIVAVTLDGVDWGPFNPHVTEAVHLPSMGARLHAFLDQTDVVIAMGGGVGTLHELTAALWYAGNIRSLPVVVAGPTARRLVAFLRHERWLYSSPTRPLDFLHEIDTAVALAPVLQAATVSPARAAAC